MKRKCRITIKSAQNSPAFKSLLVGLSNHLHNRIYGLIVRALWHRCFFPWRIPFGLSARGDNALAGISVETTLSGFSGLRHLKLEIASCNVI